MAEIKIIENPSELGAGTRGASLGIGALKVAAHNQKSAYFGNFERFVIDDENERLNDPVQYKFALRAEGILSIYQRVSDTVSHVLKEGDFPLILAGDHSSAGGTIAGIKAVYPEKRLGVVWVDAHADMHTPLTTPSGNMHGMPLATALGITNEESKINEADSEGLEFWEQMLNLNGVSPKIQADDLVFVGVRDTEKPEDDLIERLGIRNFEVAEVRSNGVNAIVESIKDKLADCDMIYVSFDVDSMDCDLVSRGTGTPVPNGLTEEEALGFVRQLSSWEKCCCLEFVEINPCLDDKINTMAETAFRILESTTEELQKRFE